MIWQPDGRNGKPRSMSAFEAPAGLPGQGSEPMVEPELLAVMPDEVQDRQDRLVAGSAQPAAKLLQEQRRAFRGS